MEDNKALAYYEKFEDLLKGDMEPAEQQLLEQELKNDPELRNEFDLFKLSVEVTNIASIRNEVKAAKHRFLEQHRQNSNSRSVRLVGWAMRIAAGLLAIFVCYGVVRFSFVNTLDLYTDLYTEYKLPITRSSDVEYAHLDSLYLSQRYSEVVDHFYQVQDKDPRDYFLAGVSYMKEARYDRAISIFQQLKTGNRESGLQDFEQESDYYLALAYLNNKNFDEALALFKAIKSNPTHIYRCNISSQEMIDLRILKWKN